MDRPLPRFPRLTTNPEKLGGKPCIRGMRISMVDVLRILDHYEDRAELFADYPDLEPADITEVLSFAASHP